jgi:toxin ParE1/3/4
MPRARFSVKAKGDIALAAKFIARENPVAARNWAHGIRQTCRLLATQPRVDELRTDLAPSDCRSFSVGAYVIYFREADNGIEVVRVLHGSRDIRSL